MFTEYHIINYLSHRRILQSFFDVVNFTPKIVSKHVSVILLHKFQFLPFCFMCNNYCYSFDIEMYSISFYLQGKLQNIKIYILYTYINELANFVSKRFCLYLNMQTAMYNSIQIWTKSLCNMPLLLKPRYRV